MIINKIRKYLLVGGKRNLSIFNFNRNGYHPYVKAMTKYIIDNLFEIGRVPL